MFSLNARSPHWDYRSAFYTCYFFDGTSWFLNWSCAVALPRLEKGVWTVTLDQFQAFLIVIKVWFISMCGNVFMVARSVCKADHSAPPCEWKAFLNTCCLGQTCLMTCGRNACWRDQTQIYSFPVVLLLSRQDWVCFISKDVNTEVIWFIT